MSAPHTWNPAHRGRLVMGLLLVSLAVIAVESALLRRGSGAGARTDARAAAPWVAGGAGRPVSTEVRLRLRNVRFMWSDAVYIDTGNMAVRAVPMHGTIVNFDDPASFHLDIQQSVVHIRPDVLAAMFNENIFNYPGSRVRHLRVRLGRDDEDAQMVELAGTLNLLAPIPFTMATHLGVDTVANTLVITVRRLNVFRIIPATRLIRWTPLHLERLIALPPNANLRVDGNRIMVSPFGLFPPPRIDGTIAGVTIERHTIGLVFAGDAIPAPESSDTNYVYMRGGTSRFGRIQMQDTDVLLLDENPADPFAFSLLHYADMLPLSTLSVSSSRAIRMRMPDFRSGTPPQIP